MDLKEIESFLLKKVETFTSFSQALVVDRTLAKKIVSDAIAAYLLNPENLKWLETRPNQFQEVLHEEEKQKILVSELLRDILKLAKNTEKQKIIMIEEAIKECHQSEFIFQKLSLKEKAILFLHFRLYFSVQDLSLLLCESEIQIRSQLLQSMIRMNKWSLDKPQYSEVFVEEF